MTPPLTRAEPIPRDALGRLISQRTGELLVTPDQTRRAAETSVQACQLSHCLLRTERIVILELGMGIGSRLLMSLLSWRKHLALPANQPTGRHCHFHYVAIESAPLPLATMQQALLEAGFSTPETALLDAAWPPLTPGFHRIALQKNFSLTLVIAPTAQALRQLSCQADCVFLNRRAFGHATTASAVDFTSLKPLMQLVKPACTVYTDLPFAPLSQALGRALTRPPSERQNSAPEDAHQASEATPWPGKLQPYKQARRYRRPDHRVTRQHAVVIGAGIAGLAMANRLTESGWPTTLVDAAPDALSGGSSQPVLAGHVHFSSDDNPLARLTRSAQAQLSQLPGSQRSSRWQMANSEAESARFSALVQALGFPAELLCLGATRNAPAQTGWPFQLNGLWQPGSQVLFPHRLRDAVLPRVNRLFGVTVTAMTRTPEQQWALQDQHRRTVATASVVIFCTANIPPWLDGADDIPVQAIAGQSTQVRDKEAAALQCVVGGDAYACSLGDGSAVTGSSWQPLGRAPAPGQPWPLSHDAQSHNLAGWQKLKVGTNALATAPDTPQIVASHAGVRYTTTDRLPLIGAIPDAAQVLHNPDAWVRNERLPLPCLPGVFLAAGFGSRGALWAALAATLIGDLLEDAPTCIENQLFDAVAPQRFLRQRLRRDHLA